MVQAKDTDFRFSIYQGHYIASIYQGRYIAVHCPDCSPPRPEAPTITIIVDHSLGLVTTFQVTAPSKGGA